MRITSTDKSRDYIDIARPLVQCAEANDLDYFAPSDSDGPISRQFAQLTEFAHYKEVVFVYDEAAGRVYCGPRSFDLKDLSINDRIGFRYWTPAHEAPVFVIHPNGTAELLWIYDWRSFEEG